MEPFGVWWYGTLSVAYFITLFLFPDPMMIENGNHVRGII